MEKKRKTKYSSYIRKSDSAKIYVATVELPADPATGKRRQTRLTATTQRELDAIVTALKSDIHNRTLISNEMAEWPISRYLSWWLDERYSTGRIAQSTYDRYGDEIRRDIVPVIGGVPVGELTELHIEQVQKTGLKRGLSPATINLVHNILHRALKDAKRLRIVRENVVEYVEPLKEKAPKTAWWTVQQIAQFLRSVETDPLHALWQLALLAGLRRGELLGLKWADIDLAARILVVGRSYSRRGGKYVDGPTKSDSSQEPILLSESVVEGLLAHRERQREIRERAGEAYQDNDLVFATYEGLHIHPNTLRYRFQRLVKQAGLPNVRIHDMRHSNGSAMGSIPGANMRKVQARLRHASLRTTERYMHPDVAGQMDIVRGLDDQISGHNSAA